MGLVLIRSNGEFGHKSNTVVVGRRLASADEVRIEAARRLKAIGYEEWRVREFMSGRPMPSSVRFLQMQIAFASDALAQLDPIPEDFRSDRYWPAE